MPQTLRQDNIPKMVVASTTTATLAITSGGQPTLCTIAGQQYSPASLLTLNAATVGANGLDAGSLGASQLWYVYAIVHQTSFAMALVASLSAAPAMPTGYGTAYKLIGAFNTNASSQISFTVSPEDGNVYPVPAAYVGGPTTMDDATATRMGLKVYSHGTTYNGGNAPTITLTGGGGTLSSVTESRFVPMQAQDGNWYLSGGFSVVLSSATRSQAVLSVNGIVSIASAAIAGSCNAPVVECFIGGALNTFVVNTASVATAYYYFTFSMLPLASKPTWAY